MRKFYKTVLAFAILSAMVLTGCTTPAQLAKPDEKKEKQFVDADLFILTLIGKVSYIGDPNKTVEDSTLQISLKPIFDIDKPTGGTVKLSRGNFQYTKLHPGGYELCVLRKNKNGESFESLGCSQIGLYKLKSEVEVKIPESKFVIDNAKMSTGSQSKTSGGMEIIVKTSGN